MLCDAGYPTYLLGTWVREKQAITLEEGVRKLTSDPADLFGLNDRGRLAKGAPADVAIFDPEREWCVDPHQMRSKGKNTPLAGHFLRGQVVATIVGGEVVYEV
jgi:dihydroorotase-like cyclic amidohydrolase